MIKTIKDKLGLIDYQLAEIEATLITLDAIPSDISRVLPGELRRVTRQIELHEAEKQGLLAVAVQLETALAVVIQLTNMEFIE